MNNEFKQLIYDWHERVHTNQKAHYAASKRFNKLHYTIGVPAIVLSAIAGATLLTEIDNALVKVIVGLIGLFAAILSGIQTFYSPAKRSEAHRVAAIRLGQIRREIEILDRFPPTDKKTQEEMIKQISDRIAKVEEDSPVVDTLTIDSLRKKKEHEEDGLMH